MTLQEMIAAAQKRVNEATDDTAKAKAEAELAALKRVESAGYTRQSDLNEVAGAARTEGKTQGEKEARAATMRAVGIDPDADDADAQLEALKKLSDGQKSEAERYKSESAAWKEKFEKAEKERDKNDRSLRERDRRDAIRQALSDANYKGKTGHAMGAIDASFADKVMESEGKFNATEAVKALKEDEFPGFSPDTPGNPEPTPQSKKAPAGTSLRDRRKQQKQAS